MVDDSQIQQAIDAVTVLHLERGDGYCFPADEIWTKVAGTPPPSGQKPHVVKRLASLDYLIETGRTTRAVSSARKGAPTTEYTFGPAISPESINLAWAGANSNWSYLEDEPLATGKRYLGLPLQRLLHGCPGSGKSYRLEQEAASAHWTIRAVFHPETRYSDFVGGLRPVSIYRIDDASDAPKFIGAAAEVPGEPYVHYVVQPGPMLKAYHLACANPDKSVILLIEELSRAVAAHVFGDTLQLLDRLEGVKGAIPAGYSEYEIEPRADISAWLGANAIGHKHVRPGRMRFPDNLYIWATMNRSDQNARQLDSAFLRRWDKEYLSYLQECVYGDTKVLYGGAATTWEKLRVALNERLKDMGGVPEDKFIGPYFLSPSKLKNPNAVAEDLWGYLWNDVLKTRAPNFFPGMTTLAELLKTWDGGQGAPLGDL